MYRPFPIRAKAEAKGRHPKDRTARAAFLAGALWGYRERTEPACGLIIHNGFGQEPVRPISFTEAAIAVRTLPHRIVVEDISRDGTGYQGPLSGAPRGRMEIIGPDPWLDRRYRGWLVRDEKGIRLEPIE